MVENPNKHRGGFPSGIVCSVNIRKDVGCPKGRCKHGEPFLCAKPGLILFINLINNIYEQTSIKKILCQFYGFNHFSMAAGTNISKPRDGQENDR